MFKPCLPPVFSLVPQTYTIICTENIIVSAPQDPIDKITTQCISITVFMLQQLETDFSQTDDINSRKRCCDPDTVTHCAIHINIQYGITCQPIVNRLLLIVCCDDLCFGNIINKQALPFCSHQ